MPTEEEKKVKRHRIIKNTVLSALALVGAWYVYDQYQAHKTKEANLYKRDFVPVQTSKETWQCPVYQQGPNNARLDEREAYAHVVAGLDAHERFPEELRRAVVREVLIGLESGMGMAGALTRAENALFQGIAQDANTNIFERNGVCYQVAYGLSRLQTNFPTPVAVQTRDVPKILKAVPFCLEVVKANLASYSADEARTMLKTFGTMMARPNLGEETVQYVGKNQAWAIESQKNVLRETARGIRGGLTPHEASCRAVSVVFNDTQTPIAFHAYAQTSRILHGKEGKTHSQMLGALWENLTQLREDPQGWIGKNTGWLLTRQTPPHSNTNDR